MAYIGYARVSTEGQNIARQIKELEEYGCEIIYRDAKSGKGQRQENALSVVNPHFPDAAPYNPLVLAVLFTYSLTSLIYE
ncbi:recombinase family protein [Shouchella patagoniensis]|uniref:recombinase family protein n=1 Tax=Shouchella patagoniensis TaxID=228576 RepID=UPI000994A26F